MFLTLFTITFIVFFTFVFMVFYMIYKYQLSDTVEISDLDRRQLAKFWLFGGVVDISLVALILLCILRFFNYIN